MEAIILLCLAIFLCLVELFAFICYLIFCLFSKESLIISNLDNSVNEKSNSHSDHE